MKIPQTTQNLTKQYLKGIDYAVRNRKGTINHLRAKCGKETLDEFITQGLIKDSTTSKGKEIYKITKDGDDFYKKLFGNAEYYKARITGFFKKILRKF